MEETTGDRIGRALKAAGVTQREAATYCGVSERTIYGWIKGRMNPSGERLAKLAALTGVTASELLTGEQTVDGSEMLREMRHLRAAQEETLAAVLEVRRLVEGPPVE